MRAGRLACVFVPLFPLAARLRAEPELTREALAVFDGNGPAARLVAATRIARRAGLKAGLTLPQGRALLPKLVARPRDPDCERSAQEALVEAAETISPRVEDAGEGVVFVDLAGLERHFPGETFEHQAALALTAAAEKAGLAVRVGVAASKLAARVAAESPGSPKVVPEGEEAAFLAPLPLAALTPEIRVASTLERWGVRSIGELARLPAAEVKSRLGRSGEELHARSRGIDPQPLLPRQPPPSFREGMTLEWPIVALEPFLFVGRSALERLTRRLEGQGLAAKRLELSLRLEPDGCYERTIELPSPTRDVKTLLTLVQLELEARPPGGPVAAFSFAAHPDHPREAQLTLFGPAELSPDRLATTLARLFALLGPERVGSPRPLDAHRPEGFTLVPFEPPPPPPTMRPPRRGLGLLTVRVLRPPVPLEVLVTGPPLDEVAEPTIERPACLETLKLLSVASTVAAATDKRPKIGGRVRVAAGPWGLEEEWWSESPTARDYWDVELAGGGVYRIYRERLSGEWFADGVYD
ncbi:MAG TPA: DNA polymerase Y family protein [Thermoanaerobaculia bacterium]|nr:DNA polymerase Y family protein [Thermoanaerobaculia bacterium]